jgi:hypothetical protein
LSQSRYHLLAEMQQNLGGLKFTDDRDMMADNTGHGVLIKGE